jgi:large subunit ribosomal protein L30
MAKKLKITQVKSLIGSQPRHKLTMKAIGFHRHQETLTKDDTPQLRGMLHQVRHLVHVEEVKAARRSKVATPKAQPTAKPDEAAEAPAKTDAKEAQPTEAPATEPTEAATMEPDKEKAE